jgi:tetratricopeptide (TPR) repeat protein
MTLRRTIQAAIVLLFAVIAASAKADEYNEVAQLTRDGRHSEAITKADGFLSAKPRDAQMRFLKGVAQRDAGKNSDAIGTFTRLTEDFPELPEPFNNLGVIYADQNQIDKARSAFEAALRTHPSYAAAHENLGDLYSKLSSAAYSKALQIEGSSAAVNPKLGLMRQLIGPGQPKITVVATVPSTKPVPTAPTLAPSPTSVATRDVAKNTPAQGNTAVQPSPQAPTPNKAATEGAARDAETAVQNWVSAWSNKDLKAYFNAYSNDFKPSGGASHSAWEAERRSRIEGKAKISVRIEGLQVAVNGNKATAKFRQDYRANGLAISSRKTLDLVKGADGWKIVREAVGGA